MALQTMSFYNRKKEEPYDYSQARSIPGQNAPAKSAVSQYNPASSNYWANTPVKTAPTTSGYDYSQARSIPGQNAPAKTTTPTTQPSTSDQLLQKLSQIAKDRSDVEKQRAMQQEQRLTERQNAASAMLPTQQATLEAAREKAVGNIKSGITSQEAQTAADKQAIEELYGAQQREAAQAQREEQGNLQNLFAGLGTVDSSVFQNQAANSAARLTGRTQSISAQKTRDLVAAERALSDYKTTAQQLIDQEQANFDTALQNIQLTYAQGTQDYNDAIIAAWNTAQDNIYQIENDVTQKELAFEQEKAKAGLTSGTTSAESENKGKALQMVNNLLSGNYQAVSGGFRTPGFLAPIIPGAGAARTDWEGLKNLLAMAKRGELKGSGAVSDFESKMLEKAALAGLGPELPEAEFKRRLELLQQDLMAGGAVDDRTQDPTGNSLQIGGYTVSY